MSACAEVVAFQTVPNYRAEEHYVNPTSNECKRRKLKCSGGDPCSRCGRDDIRCVYSSQRPVASTQEGETKDDG